jgi:type II secretory pathway component GspD/PulD (secretin)
VLVRRIYRLNDAEVRSAVGAFATTQQNGLVVTKDGILIISDRPQVLARINDLFERLGAVEAVTWAVQLFVLSVSTDRSWSAGVDGEHDIGLDVVSGTAAAGAPIISGAEASLRLNARLNAAYQSNATEVLLDPCLLLADGSDAHLVRGQSIPVRVQTILQNGGGSQATTQLQVIQTGVELAANAREVSAETLSLHLQFELSSLDGFRDQLPLRSVERLEITSTVEHGGTYLLGSLVREQRKRGRSGLAGLVWSRGAENGRLEVWARVVRMGHATAAGLVGGQGPADQAGEALPRMEGTPDEN